MTIVDTILVVGTGIIIGAILVRLSDYLNGRFPDKTIKADNNELTSLKYQINSLTKEIGGLEAILGTKEKELNEVERQKEHLHDMLQNEAEKNRNVLSQKKSSEIRTGHIAETLAPFLFEGHDPKKLRWLGQPIDYIAFDNDKITFIEVKSGKSGLSHNQKKYKQLVMEGKVEWEEFRISKGSKSTTSKRTKKKVDKKNEKV